MEKTGLIDKRIIKSASMMDTGRKDMMAQGRTEQGRKIFVQGIDNALNSFKDAQRTQDATVIVLSEQTFLECEYDKCDRNDRLALNSLKVAIRSFDDARLALKIVEEKNLYQGANNTYSSVEGKDRKSGVPIDVFHKACQSHKTRLQNSLRSTSISMLEKDLYKQRISNMSTAINLYTEKQKLALDISPAEKSKKNDRER
jgi:hypothetical protein